MPPSRSAATAPSCCGHARFAHLLLVVIAAFFVLFFAWASWATLDEVTRGDGRVIPSSQVQVVQNLEGGIVSAILVREGEIVERGQVLLRIDNVRAASDLRENRKRHLALLGALARLRAEVGETGIDFAPQVLAERRRGRAQRGGAVRRAPAGAGIGARDPAQPGPAAPAGAGRAAEPPRPARWLARAGARRS